MDRDDYQIVERDFFSTIVSDWSQLCWPLRPSVEDAAIVQRQIGGLQAGANAVILGLTPELVGCRWPRGTRLFAVDHSQTMIDRLWDATGAPPGSTAVLADWLSIPIPSNSIDFVAGDGCFMLFEYPSGFEALAREIRRIVRPTGRFSIRVFLRPDESEPVEEIGRSLASGEIESVHALKLRLWAALHGRNGKGIRLRDVWPEWKKLPPVPAAQLGSPGWTDEEIASIERYRDLDARFFLPTLDEFRTVLATAFREVECASIERELGSRCPTLVFAPVQDR